MIRYSVPTKTAGTVKRQSARHLLDGKRYHFVTVHTYNSNGEVYRVTWSGRRDLAHRPYPYTEGRVSVAEVVEILPEHMR